MKLIIILGDSAVGKMTVGQELTKITNLRLFHNHHSIEPVIDVFGYFNSELIEEIRWLFFNHFIKTDLEGLIFTYQMDFDDKKCWDYITKLSTLFKSNQAEVYYIELYTTLEERLKRNSSENRLLHKPTKRNIDESKTRLLKEYNNHRLISRDGEVTFKNYLKIDNTNLSASETAKLIKKTFVL